MFDPSRLSPLGQAWGVGVGGGHLADLSGVLWFVENVLRLRSGPDQVAPSLMFGLVKSDMLENRTKVGTRR